MLRMDQDRTSSAAAAIPKRRQTLSAAMKRTSEWIHSQDAPNDITVLVGGTAFNLNKFLLVSKSGYMRKLISQANDSEIIKISEIPGGIEAFEFAAKFCYGVNFEINPENVAMLRCVSEYLEMTEEYTDGNLVRRSEDYFEEVVLANLSAAVTVLQKSESFLPISEKVKLVSRCISAIAYMACNDIQFSLSTDSHASLSSSLTQSRAIMDWCGEELTILRIDTFKKLITEMKAMGFKPVALGPILMLYVHKSLRGLDLLGKERKKMEPKQEHEKRVVLETIVSLLPKEKNVLSVSFLSMLLRAAVFLETTMACRLDLEKRMGMQLGQAALDDLLIPSFSFDGGILFDVDMIQRVMMNYLEHEADEGRIQFDIDDEFTSSISGMDQVGRLIESYLAEIASDPNLPISKFISLAELIPEQARFTEDSMYRAIDIYFKAHPSLSDADRKQICEMMDLQKLSREACAHAAQNERLPVQIVVQVLHNEQQRLRNASSRNYYGGDSPAFSQKLSMFRSNYHLETPSDELSRLRSENDNLKLELMRMQAQRRNEDKPSVKQAVSGKPPLPKKSLVNSVSKQLSRLYPFNRADGAKTPSRKAMTKPAKDRRHSIS
ncbi:NPH3 domain-containing protein [Dioscorea alata]|uniref:NPH3 domain-containing protein n=1 Tax=Dioscorea alata TaxID=55571 RepID=A0ACB7UWT8_DIOAL|nr:NPH3 domain-containing protein [Dioscorea alata]